jgi:hypothetical protein
MRWVLWLVFVVIAVLSGCIGSPESGGDATSESTAVPSSSTTAPTTTTAPATATPTALPPTTTTTTEPPTTEPSPPAEPFIVDLTNVLEPPPEPGSGGALGSGCTPGIDMFLDGVWAGWVIERAPDHVQFDLACMYSGPEEPGLQNQSNQTRSIPVSTSAVIYAIEEDVMFDTAVPYTQWQIAPISPFCADVMITPSFPSGCPVWLYVNDGVVTEITEFFLS